MSIHAAAAAPEGEGILGRLEGIVGAERLVTSAEARRLLALDFSEEPGCVPLAVLGKASLAGGPAWLGRRPRNGLGSHGVTLG